MTKANFDIEKHFHIPVLLREVIDYLDVKKGGRYIDCTFGFGGHSFEILKRGGKVLGLDSDKESLEVAGEFKVQTCLPARQGSKFKDNVGGLTLENANFSRLEEVARKQGFTEVNGILYDLGLSSWQLSHSGRGFSFQKDEPLDMRADLSLGVTAADLINTLSANELTKLFKNFGQEHRARRFAKALVHSRSIKPIETTVDLLNALGVKKGFKDRIHPATQVFQALRIAVNSELLNLSCSLPQAQKLLGAGGKLVVISFHSLEDRLVSEFGNQASNLKSLTPKPVVPSTVEAAENPRARSAKLRAFEKL
ncbi:MAG: 16S rRNA (cytosine(1402)-N(4))-methyltransferase RsmH [bacterium]